MRLARRVACAALATGLGGCAASELRQDARRGGDDVRADAGLGVTGPTRNNVDCTAAYGLDPAGQRDARPGLQACLDATVSYGTALLRAGNYRIDAPLVMARALKLQASGGAVRLKPSSHQAIVDFPDVPNQASLVGVAVDFSGAGGSIPMTQYFVPAKPSPIVLHGISNTRNGAFDFPITQVFGPGYAFWVSFPKTLNRGSAVPMQSNGFLRWDLGRNDGYIYLKGEMRDALQNMPSYLTGNVTRQPGHPYHGLAYAYLNAPVGIQHAITSPTQVNYEFPLPASQARCPKIQTNGKSNAVARAGREYHLKAFINTHATIDLGGDLGFQDVVALQIFSNYNQPAPQSTYYEVYYLSHQWGYVGYDDNGLGMSIRYNKLVAAGDKIGSLYAKNAAGYAWYNYPGPVDCLGQP
jgi:hypothetical protein